MIYALLGALLATAECLNVDIGQTRSSRGEIEADPVVAQTPDGQNVVGATPTPAGSNASKSPGADQAAQAPVAQSLGVDPKPMCGIIWFYHFPKAGGESVNRFFLDMRDRKVITKFIEIKVRAPAEFHDFHTAKIEPILANPHGKLFFVHHHDQGPGLAGAETYMEDMKNRLRLAGCDLYRMTYLREPEKVETSTAFFYGFYPLNVHLQSYSQHKIFDNPSIRFLLNNFAEDTLGNLIDQPLCTKTPEPECSTYCQFPMDLGKVNETALQRALGILRTFEFVGLTEHMQDGIAQVVQETGLPKVGEFMECNRNYLASMMSLPSSMGQDLKKKSSMDEKLYEAAREMNRVQRERAGNPVWSTMQSKAVRNVWEYCKAGSEADGGWLMGPLQLFQAVLSWLQSWSTPVA